MSSDAHKLSPVQQVVTEIWENELNVSGIRLEDDFFVLNGDSLSMLSMLFKVSKALGVELSPGALFENSSLGAFSQAVSLALESKPACLGSNPNEILTGGV